MTPLNDLPRGGVEASIEIFAAYLFHLESRSVLSLVFIILSSINLALQDLIIRRGCSNS